MLHKSVQNAAPMLLGYARVSTGSQSLEAQLEALKAAGCERVYAEKRSGADGERKELVRLLKAARPDDTVVGDQARPPGPQHSRSLQHTHRLAKAGVGFKSLRETAVDTTTAQGRLVVSILSAISEFERELILARISEGRKRARQNGIRFGRKPKLTAYQRQEPLERLAAGESQSTIARTFNVDRATISRLARQ
jgi:DNA invertase Pin-like site-specific DNA recombinase